MSAFKYVLVVVGVLSAVPQVLDIFLNDHQKASIEAFALRCWSRLEELSKLPFGMLAQRQLIISLSSLSVSVMSACFGGYFFGVQGVIVPVLASMVVYMALSEGFIDNDADFFHAFLWTGVGQFVMMVILFVGIYILTRFPDPEDADSMEKYNMGYYTHPGFLEAIWSFAGVLLCSFLILLLVLFSVRIVQAILWISEFTIRKLLEYPKGPLLTFGLLFGAVLSFLKVF